MIFIDIDDFKKYVGGGANKSLEIESIAPTIQDAFEQYLRPWLGDTLADEILHNATATALETLMPHVKRPLAKLTMHKYSRIGAIQFSEGGMYRVETDNMRSAYK
ncbi:MAG: DUF6712 family protein, partial [Plesiomonas sp.]